MLPHSEAETIVEWQRKTGRGGRKAKRGERERERERRLYALYASD